MRVTSGRFKQSIRDPFGPTSHPGNRHQFHHHLQTIRFVACCYLHKGNNFFESTRSKILSLPFYQVTKNDASGLNNLDSKDRMKFCTSRGIIGYKGMCIQLSLYSKRVIVRTRVNCKESAAFFVSFSKHIQE